MWINGCVHGLNGFKPIKHRYEHGNIDIWVCLNMGYVQPNYRHVPTGIGINRWNWN